MPTASCITGRSGARTRRRGRRVFQASKSAVRGKAGALAELDQTLKRLQTDYLDLWQIHDIRTPEDIEMIGGPGGALEAFVEAKASGRVRFIGVTGHRQPEILTRAVEDWPVDAVMMPVNPVEGVLGGFLTSTLPAAREKGHRRDRHEGARGLPLSQARARPHGGPSYPLRPGPGRHPGDRRLLVPRGSSDAGGGRPRPGAAECRRAETDCTK